MTNVRPMAIMPNAMERTSILQEWFRGDPSPAKEHVEDYRADKDTMWRKRENLDLPDPSPHGTKRL